MPILRNGDYELACNEDDHIIRSQEAAAFLQLPGTGNKGFSRESSTASAMDEMEAPMLVKESSHADDSAGLNSRLIFAITAATVGSAFQHGYHTGVVNAPQKLIESWIRDVEGNRTETEINDQYVTMIWSVAVSIFGIGGMVGGLLTGYVADKMGRKAGLLWNNIIVLASCILQGSSKHANSYEMIILGRFLIGINCGLNAGLVPIYLSEISPVRLRGAVGTVYQLVLVVSILASQILGLEAVMGTEELWPLLLAISIIPAVFQMLTLPFCPESPKYLLLTQGKEVKAKKALAWVRNTTNVQDEIEEMKIKYEEMKLIPKVTFREMYRNTALRIPLIISVMVMIAQQFSGINAVMFFSTQIFEMSKLSAENAQYATIIMGVMNVVVTIFSLILVEKAGRKTLLLVGFGGMLIDTIFLTICLAFAESSIYITYLNIVLIVVFVLMFAVGPGPIPWFLVTELFNESARSHATSIAVAVNWMANFFVGLGFLPLQNMMGGYVFLIFVVLLAFFVVFVWRKVPETKNKTIEQISGKFRRGSY